MNWLILTVLSFICVGLVQISFKMVPSGQAQEYLLFSYGSAFIFTGAYLLVRKSMFYNSKDIIFGIVLGVSTVIQAFFYVRALQGLPGVLVYPVVSIATIVLVTIFSWLVFKERLRVKGILAITFGVFAILLLFK